MLDGLRSHLMEPELFKAFCDEFTREVNRSRVERDTDIINRRKELERIDRELDNAIQAILDGVPGAKLKDRIGGLEARKIELLELVSETKESVPLLHPNMAAIFRQRISALCESLGNAEGKVEAVEVLRTLVDQIALVRNGDELTIVLRGDLAAILTFASNKKRPDLLSEAGLLGDLISPVSVVAGTRFHLNLRPEIALLNTVAASITATPAEFGGLLRAAA